MIFRRLLVLLIGCVTVQFAAAQTQWPVKPYRIVIGYPQGGAMDLIVRLGAERIQAKTGHALILESRPGASGHLATEQVFKAAPDGYTLMVAPPAYVTTPFMFTELPFDPETLVPITLLANQPNVFAVNPGRLPDVMTLQQLIDRAKANPGKLNYGSPGNGGSGHLSMELLKMLVNVDILHVPSHLSG
ncbi:MAG: Bug family tripartite tricarboxylate transporter substrate binding protein [Burkholderiales bacterium]